MRNRMVSKNRLFANWAKNRAEFTAFPKVQGFVLNFRGEVVLFLVFKVKERS